jgi:hypothetical protein
LHNTHNELEVRARFANALGNCVIYLSNQERMEDAANLVNELRCLHEAYREPSVGISLARGLAVLISESWNQSEEGCAVSLILERELDELSRSYPEEPALQAIRANVDEVLNNA